MGTVRGWFLSPQLPLSLPSARHTHPSQILELVLSSDLGIAFLVRSKVDVAQMQDAGHDA